MIPQGSRLVIQASDGQMYVVVGWLDYGRDARPFVVPLGGQQVERASVLDGDLTFVAVPTA